MKLSKAEEHLMRHLWKLGNAYMKDLILEYDDPKPAVTTIATLLKRMKDKKYIDYKVFGKAREYFPLVKEEDYVSVHVSGIIKNYFGDSASQFASFFTKSSDFSASELESLKSIIDEELKKKTRKK